MSLVTPIRSAVSQTFIQAHADRLPATVSVVYRDREGRLHIDGTPACPEKACSRWYRGLVRTIPKSRQKDTPTREYVAAFRRTRAAVVLAEYGHTGVAVREACRRSRLPLVVHFHGYDASRHDILERYRRKYMAMFQQAGAIVAVSGAMVEQLLRLGAPPEKVFRIPCGVDCERFVGANPASTSPSFLSVGRFVEEKDVAAMAEYMTRILHSPRLAADLGQAARLRIEHEFTMERSIGRLWKILKACTTGRQPTAGDDQPQCAASGAESY